MTSTCFYIEHFKRDQWWTNIVEESLQVTFSDLFLAPPHSPFRSFVHSFNHPFIFFSGSRHGECPVPNPIPACDSITGCDSDKRCALGERCCLQSNCTKTCVKAVVPPPPPPHGGKYYKQQSDSNELFVVVQK